MFIVYQPPNLWHCYSVLKRHQPSPPKKLLIQILPCPSPICSLPLSLSTQCLTPSSKPFLPTAPGPSLTPAVSSQIHLDGEIEVLRAEGPVRVMELAQGHLRQELWGPQSDTMVVMGVPMAQPLQVQCHAEVRQVKEAAVVIPASQWSPNPQ